MAETTYSLQIAKSSRAKCKVCKNPIPKGEMKILLEVPAKEGQDYGVSSSYFVSCFKIPRKLKVDVDEFVEEHLVDGTDQNLLLDRKDEIIQKLKEASAKTKKSKKGNGEEDDSIMARLKAASKNAAADEDEEEPAKKKAKKESGNGEKTDISEGEEFKDMLTVYRRYANAKVPELKDILRWNQQIMTGNKDFVLFKVIDGVLHGRLGVCPICSGNLKFVEGDFDKVHCSGRYDEDIGRRIPCNYTSPRVDSKVPRNQPFYITEPTEEEKEELQRLKEEAQEGADLTKSDNPVMQELLEKAGALELDFDSNEGKKKAAADFLAIVEGKLDLPKNRNSNMEIGKLVLANIGKPSKEIMEVLIKKYGFADVKKEQAAAKEAQVEGACANPKNAALVLAFQECAKYYFQEGNHNAGSSYIKAVDALTNLKEEVTEDNAMSFCKGKTKIPGIGKGSASKMLEFVQTGTFAKLEEKRSAHA